MKKLISYYIILVGIITLNSCEIDDDSPLNKEYTISGNISSVEEDPAGYTLEIFHKKITGLDIDYTELGLLVLDSLGNFECKYKTSKQSIGEIILYLYDKKGKSVTNFQGNQFAANWHKEFNFSKYANVEVTFNTNNPLNVGDTLFIDSPVGLLMYTAPFPNGTKKTYVFGNSGTRFKWSRERNKLYTNGTSISFYPTGQPKLDELTINY